MKRLIVFILLLSLFIANLPASPVKAQSSIIVSKNEIESDFPDRLIFQVSASSSLAIQDIKLMYRTNAATCQAAVATQKIEFMWGISVDAQWSWDFTQSGVLPPGAEIYWQWQLTDRDGNTLITDEQSYLVNDTRNSWNTLKSGQVTLQWYEGSNSFGRSLLGYATSALDRMAKNTGIKPDGQVWLTIYPTTLELLEVDIYASEWAGGIAYPEYNSSIMAIGTDELEWASSVIPHELAHLVTDSATFNCKGIRLPTWLSEGLAVYAEGSTPESSTTMVTTALDEDNLPPLRTLASGFSSDANAANLSYAQSGVVVTYMIDQYGAEYMTDLLATMQSGSPIDAALQHVYRKNTDGIDGEWRISLGYTPRPTLVPTSSSRTSVPTLALWTSAVQPTAMPLDPPTLTPTAVAATLTPIPTDNLSQVTPPSAVESTGPGQASSNWIIALYILGITCTIAILAIIGIIVLFILTRRERTKP